MAASVRPGAFIRERHLIYKLESVRKSFLRQEGFICEGASFKSCMVPVGIFYFKNFFRILCVVAVLILVGKKTRYIFSCSFLC